MHISKSTRKKQSQFKSLMHMDDPADRTAYTAAIPSGRPSTWSSVLAVLIFGAFIGGCLLYVGTIVKNAHPGSSLAQNK